MKLKSRFSQNNHQLKIVEKIHKTRALKNDKGIFSNERIPEEQYKYKKIYISDEQTT